MKKNTILSNLDNSIKLLSHGRIKRFMNWQTVKFIQGGPEKNGTAYFPQYVDAITGTSV